MGFFNIFGKKKGENKIQNQNRKILSTNGGMWALWDYEQYKDITTLEEWEKCFCNDCDILKQIDISKIVPVNMNSDGCYEFEIKIDEALSDRESKYIYIKSEEYLFETDGTAIFSGIEHVDSDVGDDCIRLSLEKGKYSVTVCMMDWEAEPGMQLKNGKPAPGALPDFIITINKTNGSGNYRKSLETFEKE